MTQHISVFFNKIGDRPHIKRPHKFRSITYPGESGWQIKDDRISITFRKYESGKWKLDRVAYTFFKHREWEGDIRRITIKRDNCGDYWLCMTTSFTDTDPLPTTGESVGADFGMKDAYLTLSTGEKIQHPQPLKQSLNKLRTLNKALSRKQKGSGGWWRAVRRLARLYRRIADQRKNFHWKLATDLCDRFDTVAIETLNLDGMKRLWGRKASDLAFYQFVEILKYKCIKHKRHQKIRIGNPILNQRYECESESNQRYEAYKGFTGYEVRMDFTGYEARMGFPVWHSPRLGRKIRPRVLVQGVSLKKTLDTKRQKCYTILTSWQTCQALSQGNVSAFLLDRG